MNSYSIEEVAKSLVKDQIDMNLGSEEIIKSALNFRMIEFGRKINSLDCIGDYEVKPAESGTDLALAMFIEELVASLDYKILDSGPVQVLVEEVF